MTKDYRLVKKLTTFTLLGSDELIYVPGRGSTARTAAE